jgi:hypothetical protein
MPDNKWVQTTADLGKELSRIKSSSEGVAERFEILQREAESLKMEFLKYSLEKQRRVVARQRGFTLLITDRKKIGAGLAVTVGASILGGLMAKNKNSALDAGLSGFTGVLQGFGETKWAVSLQRHLVIVPYDAIPANGTWVTFESLIAAIDDLKMETLRGKRLGSLDDIIQRLHQSRGKLIYLLLPK